MARMRTVRVVLATLGVVAALPGEGEAVELGAVGQPAETVALDITNTASSSYHFDNRNDSPSAVGTRLDDAYLDAFNRLNLQLRWWRFSAGARLDAALYDGAPNQDDGLAFAKEDREGGAGTAERANDYHRELHSRYQPSLIPSKLWVNYTGGPLEVTAGDFYAQLGRGFVLSVRKIDELAVDTTIRGGKVVFREQLGEVRVGATVLGGQLNPLRIDEVTGRRLHGTDSPLFFGFPQAVDFYGWDAATPPEVVQIREAARPSYLEDTVLGGRIEAGWKGAVLAGNFSELIRQDNSAEALGCGASDRDCDAQYPVFSSPNPSKRYGNVRTFSGSLEVTQIADVADVYVEGAGQALVNGRTTDLNPQTQEKDLHGHAIYSAINLRQGPVVLSLEGKHYREFYPLSANVDTLTKGFGAPEFDVLSYNQVPTAEPFYTEQIGSPQVCVSGGRGRADFRFNRSASVYAWFGGQASWSELNANACELEDRFRSNTLDAAVGTDLAFENHRSIAKFWFGARSTDRHVPLDTGSTTFYREAYVRFDLSKALRPGLTLVGQGFHRFRHEPDAFGEPWKEGETYAGVQWAPHWAFVVGAEYLARRACQASDPDQEFCSFFSGSIQYKSANADSFVGQLFDTASLFVGQRRGAIRCVSGVCRQFPPFEGARIELVSRF